jgi:pectate lyase
MTERFVDAVKRWADLVLALGKDRYGDYDTPLFVDGVRIEDGQPVTWLSQGEEWILSNTANQQNLFRTLTGLSRLTGDDRYVEAAREAAAYALRNVRYGDMMCWGGHMAFDLGAKKPVHAADKGPQHELKCHYPYYELMLEIDPAETLTMIEAMWDGHVTDWDNLEFSRHGQPKSEQELKPEQGAGAPYGQGRLWEKEFGAATVFFTGKGLTFINAGSDLYYAAAVAGAFTGQEAPIRWAERLAGRYAETANPDTGLSGYQFSISVLPGQRGDRAVDQFGELLKEDRPIEATLSMPNQIHTIVGKSALCRMAIFDLLGERGRQFLDWALSDLRAYGRYAYDEAANAFHPVLTNGKRLTGIVLDKDGYYGRRGQTLSPKAADGLLFWSYAAGYRHSGDAGLWSIVRSMARGSGLGELGEAGEQAEIPSTDIRSADAHLLFGLLELAAAHPEGPFLAMAEQIGDNILATRVHNGYFVPNESRAYVKFDAIDPLALLHLAAALRGERERMPRYFGGNPFFGAAYDGRNHTIDNSFFYLESK